MWLFLVLIVLLLLLLVSCSNTYEGYRTYKPINSNRSDQCLVYKDSFYDAKLNTPDLIDSYFMNWCYGWKHRSGDYPSYRSAERAFLRLKADLDRGTPTESFLERW